MRSLVRFASCVVAAGVALCPGLASAEDAVRPYPACDRTPTQGDVAAAKGAFEAGNGSFNEADYDRAITYWEDAYRRDCTAHPLLLNLARAYELKNQKQHAVTALKTFLVRVPNSSEENQIKRRIEKLEKQIQSEAAATPAPTPTPAAAPTPPPTAPPPPVESPPPAEAPPESNGGGLPIAPIVVAGAGLAMMTTAGIIWFGANSDIKDVESVCPGRKCPDAMGDPTLEKQYADAQSKGNDAITRRNVSGIFALVGIAALVGGGVWFTLEATSHSGSARVEPRGFRATVTPTVAPGYGGMAMTGVF